MQAVHVVSGRRNEAEAARPVFGRTIAINEGRHPILDRLLGAGECVSNNV